MRIKKLHKWFCLIGIVVSMLLFLSSCDKDSKKQTATISEEETIAVINNKKISLAKFHSELHSFLKHYRQLILTDEKQLAEIKEIVINQLINDELIGQEAARKGIHVSDEEMETIVAESFSPHEGASFDNYLKNSDMTEKRWKEKLKQYLIQKKLVNEEVNSKIPITKREIKSYYQNNRQEFTIDSAIKVRNITLSTEDEAKAIRSKLLRKANFKKLIREHSISPDKVLDGDLGYIKRGDLPSEMESAIFSKKYPSFIRRVTEVVHSQDGFHVFKLERYKRRKKLNYKSAKPRIKKILVEQKWDEYYTHWLNKLRKNATISVDQAMLSREEGF